ncbi:hypothetical protein N7541_011681 [Penicillium brevicompactum]|uniref:Uncharacterized protein n=1 Tax=Penicillium brevicompactum TaxID=5074 RepID=A0A9W9QQS6_PENBR|nr:hypothetical protein N7452_006454 [Penicillium brevicompactum]KAJ5342557.1 hypothetical protein N7541_011681 [Penicillium brevicompactum]
MADESTQGDDHDKTWKKAEKKFTQAYRDCKKNWLTQRKASVPKKD